jgi:hypothetical protein
MGDTSFDLTKRIWNFIGKWGNGEAWSFVTSIDVPHGYHRPKPDTSMAMWEGICHGWAVAAGHYPRPEKTVEVKLPNGKKLPFYPDDIKALASLMFANSLLQDEVIMEGYRCWDSGPKRDRDGRVIDRMPEKLSDGILPRCADVHPAIWHMSLINLTGVQGRSFVAEIDFNAKVNNHPVQGYEIEYFNPNSGFTSRTLKGAMEAVNGKYFRDNYHESRHPEATHVVGIDMTLALTDWSSPKSRATDSPKNDGIVKRHMLYDLELDKDGNIIGGQWRVERRIPRDAAQSPNGRGIRPMPRTNQPDFFWVIPKDYMKHFASTSTLPQWNMNEGVLAPKEWKNEAMTAHSFVYQVTREFGFNEQCVVFSDDNNTPLEIPCEYKYPKPQPLVDVVNQLVELSRKK